MINGSPRSWEIDGQRWPARLATDRVVFLNGFVIHPHFMVASNGEVYQDLPEWAQADGHPSAVTVNAKLDTPERIEAMVRLGAALVLRYNLTAADVVADDPVPGKVAEYMQAWTMDTHVEDGADAEPVDPEAAPHGFTLVDDHAADDGRPADHEPTETRPASPKAAEDAEFAMIVELARRYESSGDPGCISTGVGDVGGVSHGLYQFASALGVVDEFVTWLQGNDDPDLANYGRVLAADPVNSEEFKHTWRELARVDPGNFGRLQDEFVVEQYLTPARRLLLKECMHLNSHAPALRAVVLARAVQNGPTGAKELFKLACAQLGYPNLSYLDDAYFDDQLISAVYDVLIDECDRAEPDEAGVLRSPNNLVRGSAAVVAGQRRRFVNERADALALLER